MRKIGFAFVVALCLVTGGGASPASAQVPPSIVLNPSTVEVGGSFTVTLTGFFCTNGEGVDESGDVYIRTADGLTTIGVSTPFTQVDGAGQVTLIAPSTPGTYVIFADFDRGSCPEGQATLTVIPVDTAPPSTAAPTTTTTIAGQVAPTTAPTTTTAAPVTLPATGRSTDGLVWIALVTALLGGGLVAVAARRS